MAARPPRPDDRGVCCLSVPGLSRLEVFHLCRADFWALLLPVILWAGWEDSILLVLVLSLYANAAGDVSAWQAARAERASQA